MAIPHALVDKPHASFAGSHRLRNFAQVVVIHERDKLLGLRLRVPLDTHRHVVYQPVSRSDSLSRGRHSPPAPQSLEVRAEPIEGSD